MQRLSLILRVLYAAAFVFATVENWAAFAASFSVQGWRIENASIPSTIYLHTLLVIDPGVAALLLLRPRVGLLVAGLVLATNITHNTLFYARMPGPIDSTYWLTVGFFAFYLATMIPAWRGSKHLENQKPNKAPEPTPGAVTPRATEGASK